MKTPTIETWIDRLPIEGKEKWRDWAFKIPYLKFKPEWEVRPQPPFLGAIARFRLRYKGNEISVYLDCYDRLGCYGKPYWEMHPYEMDVARFDMEDTEGLLAAIDKQFNSDWTEFYKEREERSARREALIERMKSGQFIGEVLEHYFPKKDKP